MSSFLDRISFTRQDLPDKIVVVGQEGVGKTKFAVDFPSAVIISAEDGVRHILTNSRGEEVGAYPEFTSSEDVLTALGELSRKDHPYKTLIIDTVDWLMELVFAETCAAHGWKTIDEPDYGKGYSVAGVRLAAILARLDNLRLQGVTPVIVCHSRTREFTPGGGGNPWMRYEPKLYRAGASKLKEWADSLFFARFEESADDEGKVTDTGRRVIQTCHSAAWDAKCRWDMPDRFELDYEVYRRLRGAFGMDLDAVKEYAAGLVESHGGVKSKVHTKFIKMATTPMDVKKVIATIATDTRSNV